MGSLCVFKPRITHAPFGGVKESGFGRENHKMALDRVVKNM
jgi:aldehyde dehydrogenase (NAD+)/aldehyde dehydrogenase